MTGVYILIFLVVGFFGLAYWMDFAAARRQKKLTQPKKRPPEEKVP